jgi:sugar phosphate isomerase/epimerase
MIAPLPRSLSFAGLVPAAGSPWGATPRAMMEWAAQAGWKSVHLDGAMPGLRARELDRSARRDVASVLRRVQLQFSGIDLWIPPQHFVDASHVERAVEAVCAAAELAAEIAKLNTQPVPVLSIQLHPRMLPAVLATMVAAAERSGVLLADHQWPALESWQAGGHAGIGIDPAAMFMAGEGKPIAAAQRVATRIVSARLSDVTSAGRVAAGKGRLDLLEYEVALSTASYARPVIVDLRGVAVPPLTPEAFDPA